MPDVRFHALEHRTASFVVAFVIALCLAACGGTRRHYERAGMAGAGLVLGGFAVNLVAHSTIPPRNETGLHAATGTAATMQVVGFIVAVYALDGLIRVTSDSDSGGR